MGSGVLCGSLEGACRQTDPSESEAVICLPWRRCGRRRSSHYFKPLRSNSELVVRQSPLPCNWPRHSRLRSLSECMHHHWMGVILVSYAGDTGMKRPPGYWLLKCRGFPCSLQTNAWNSLGQDMTVLVQRGKTRKWAGFFLFRFIIVCNFWIQLLF